MARAKILIVEDESIVAFNIQNRLESLGYAVTGVSPSGEGAIQSITFSRPDLVLMDIKLKGSIDGIEAAAQIRSRFQIPVVYLTAYTDGETLDRAKFTQPYGYILKPFEARDLCTTIEVALYNYQMDQQRQEREKWLATTLQSIGDAVITTDSQGLVTFMNPVAETLTRWKQEDALGNDLNQVFHAINEKTREIVDNPVELALQKGEIVGLENHTLLITKDGNEIPIDDSAAPIKNESGNILGAVLVFHDITERQQIETLLQKTNESLEVRVTETIAQLRLTNEQLRTEIAQRQHLEQELLLALEKEQELHKLKSNIVATVSHEYRTPLTTILSSIELLEKYSSTWTDERKQKHFQRIQASVKYLTELVDDMLFVNQVQTGHLTFEPVPLNVEQVARELVAEFQLNDADQHTIIFKSQGDYTNTLLDKYLLESMFRNLLSNAIKYSPQGSIVHFDLAAQQNVVVFCISDRGIGIPPDDQTRIFNAFFRGSNVGTAPGVGLGLVIVKECVDLHKGKIAIESEVGVGTSFTVTLPLVAAITSD